MVVPTATAAPGATSTPRPTTPSSTASATALVSSSPDVTPQPSLTGPSYTNPVYDSDFPDPHVVRVDDAYYAYATDTGTSNVPVIRSTDLAAWEQVGDALPGLPAWAQPNFGNTWAPSVIQIGDSFVLYFVSRDKVADKQCIGVGVAEVPEGPFRDESDEAFICQADLGGSIDPFAFQDVDGKLYLYWKNDGNCCGKPVGLWVQRLSDDGLTLRGEPVELIRRDQAWEIPLIENPAVIERDGQYYLFYSANWWESQDYAVGYAVCETATGPCVKPQEGPIFQKTDEVRGPGGEAFVTDTYGNLWMTYHAWTGADVGYPRGKRSLRIDPVSFDADGVPVINGPTSDPQPLPSTP